jgi:hypothetical protein
MDDDHVPVVRVADDAEPAAVPPLVGQVSVDHIVLDGEVAGVRPRTC